MVQAQVNKQVRYAGSIYLIKEVGERRLKLRSLRDKSLVIGVKVNSPLLEEIEVDADEAADRFISDQQEKANEEISRGENVGVNDVLNSERSDG